MMFPPDPVRQRMLFKTEWKTIGASGYSADSLARGMNEAFDTLASEGFQVSQIMPIPVTAKEDAPGMIIIGQRVSSPVADPTPQGVPLPGTNATQSIEVIYSFVSDGEVKTEAMNTLKEAVQRAAKDLEESANRSEPSAQPISIHVTSVTAYGPGDLHTLRDRFR